MKDSVINCRLLSILEEEEEGRQEEEEEEEEEEGEATGFGRLIPKLYQH